LTVFATPSRAQSNLTGIWDASITLEQAEIPFRFEIAESNGQCHRFYSPHRRRYRHAHWLVARRYSCPKPLRRRTSRPFRSSTAARRHTHGHLQSPESIRRRAHCRCPS